MHRHVIGAAILLALAGATPGFAQNQPPAPAAPAAPAAATRYSIDTKFGELFADPNAAVVVRDFFRKRREAAGKPEQTAEERDQTMEMVKDMTPREVAQYPQADLDDAALAELDALLAKVPYPPKPVATPASDPKPQA